MLAALALRLLIDTAVENLSVTPPGGQHGPAVYAGFQISKPVSPRVSLALTGRAGGAYVHDWRPAYEGTAEAWYGDRLSVHIGARHDDRLRRDGALAEFRDPTGRLFVGVAVLPFRKRHVAAGATFDYERAMPGAGRLPSGTRVTAVVRFRVRG